MSTRAVARIIRAVATSDGAGVQLRRSLGQGQEQRLDPFLMLDEFSSADPDDYVAGFPQHPHRGFETVTYMLDGHLLHEDHLGNRGDLRGGGAQWMTAGRGIIHSEMPQQTSGRMRGFQLWINLPAAEKMKPAGYRDVQPEEIPQAELPGGGAVRVVAGELTVDGRPLTGPIRGVSTEPLFADVALSRGASFEQRLPLGHNACVYVFEGRVAVVADTGESLVDSHEAGVLSPGEALRLRAVDGPARFLLLAARPIGEPVVQYGPFVMNSREEIEQALADYQAGRLAS
ncbi:MAG: pirin family protein [Pseudomonadales bacterium]